MSAYLVALITVTNQEKFLEYATLSAATAERYGAKFVIRGRDIEVVEGEMPHSRVVILEFKDKNMAKVFFDSPEYAQAKEVRREACDFHAFIVEGVETVRFS
ncbi:MAG: DUF1330 domain-containing protein [Betaproteobacteria bacterium]|jgi:uncharacterized protein (DUF1330 family)|nr:DUF1330 domain-containing protein [Polynucleobacter sp.]NBY64366.1 DUF1330 domain-containing protein [Betaproteobacteria bacterium]